MLNIPYHYVLSQVLNDSKQWWLVRNVRENQGFVPSTILTTLYEALPPRDYDVTYPSSEYLNY